MLSSLESRLERMQDVWIWLANNGLVFRNGSRAQNKKKKKKVR
jgi:hypothetical protein